MPAWPYTKGLHDLGSGGFAWLQPDGGYGYSNAGLIVDSGQALLVDTLFDVPLTQEMLDAMGRSIPEARRIDRVVNTHAHPDHTAGNLLLEGADIIASDATLQEMRQIDSPGNPVAELLRNWRKYGEAGEYLHEVMGSRFQVHAAPQLMPTRTFERELTLDVGAKEVKLLGVGPAHSRGDTLVYVPRDRLLFTGDILFHEVHPLVMPGAADAWIAACDLIDEWDIDVVVPGHGPITDKGGVRKLREYLVYFRAEARKRFDAGMDYKEATLDIALDAFHGWPDEERIFATVNNFYAEFGAKPAPMTEVLQTSGRYRRYKSSGCRDHGPSCSMQHRDELLAVLNA